MKEITGDIWDFHEQGHWVVITTNGTVKANGEAVMGRGVALQAVNRIPNMPRFLGIRLKRGGNRLYSFLEFRIITFPVKHGWWKRADIALIEISAKQLACGYPRLIEATPAQLTAVRPIYMVRPGCGNGGLDWKDVKPILERYLDDRFIVVEKFG